MSAAAEGGTFDDGKRVLYEGRYIRLVAKDAWEFAERINCSGVVFIVALTKDQKLVLCEQYRVPVGKHVIEIPAGLVNDTGAPGNETFEDAARRELLEETGYDSTHVVKMMEGPAAAGSSSAIIVFYRAYGLKKVASGGGDETENIKVHEVALSDIDVWLESMTKAGKVIDPKVFTVLYMIQSRVFGDPESRGA